MALLLLLLPCKLQSRKTASASCLFRSCLAAAILLETEGLTECHFDLTLKYRTDVQSQSSGVELRKDVVLEERVNHDIALSSGKSRG
jgi:hypothetical protein